MEKLYDGQEIEMLGEKHGGGFNQKSTGWQKGIIKKLSKTTITLKFDGWHELKIKIKEFENILKNRTMRFVTFK